ncbi:MAG: ABC transporter ATP-binding protein [Pelagibacterales bacterium]|nr:ABC transporter ATP-binding protein [Pelagibacterales bacterium]
MSKNICVEIKNISKDFAVGDQKIRVLNNINLQIYSGEMTMIVGPSGCGKTTLLSILTGILTPSEGDVIINNTNITKLKGDKKVDHRRKNLGFIFQQYNLLPALSAAENAAIPLIADGISLDKAVKQASIALSEIDMSNHLEKLPSQLSGGQQQRVAIARALVHKPSLVVCDEPTAALDAFTGQKVMETLRQSAMQQNRAVIVVTHDNRIFDFADRIIEMEDGKVITDKVISKNLS